MSTRTCSFAKWYSFEYYPFKREKSLRDEQPRAFWNLTIKVDPRRTTSDNSMCAWHRETQQNQLKMDYHSNPEESV